MQKDLVKTPIQFLKGVGPKRGELLQSELGIHTYEGLIHHYPFRYVDKSKFYKCNEVIADLPYVQIKGRIVRGKEIGLKRGKRFVAYLKDETGEVELVWFKGIKWIKDKFSGTDEYIVYGKPTAFGGKINITHPEVELVSAKGAQSTESLSAVYPATEKLNAAGLNSKGLAKVIRNAMEQVYPTITDNLSPTLLEKYAIPNRKTALKEIHFPSSVQNLQKAQFRLKYEELFFIQLGLFLVKRTRDVKIQGNVFEHVGEYTNAFYKNNLPFELTGAQKRVVKEIRQDTLSGKQMNRLLQGDVGSGKTLVALMCMLIAADNQYQSCLMAPTEILAQQHFKTIAKFVEGLGINIALLTGSTPQSQRKILHQQLEHGDIHILVGTHALIEDSVQFQNLGFVVIDEQHRFGVQQRAKLWKKNTIPPHILVMTATPIPRTMAMTLYGDLDTSIIDELPPGRKDIKTYHMYEKSRLKLFAFMKKQIAEGRQIYVVYPLIKESEKLDLKNLDEGYEAIKRDFPLPDYKIGILHGQMKPEDKNYEMDRFKRGETQIMVSTTVIEVGVDVPNATVMVIENAERFGLSQLHQLRGRVGRGGNQSFCVLMTDYKLSKEAEIRLDAMVRSNDGFYLSEVDLKLRGPGDIQGTQQSGVLSLKLADIIKDEKILRIARQDAKEILANDPMLQNLENEKIRNHYLQYYNKRFDWGKIS